MVKWANVCFLGQCCTVMEYLYYYDYFQARELSGKYSADLTRLKRHMKKQLNKEEESYMEMFF